MTTTYHRIFHCYPVNTCHGKFYYTPAVSSNNLQDQGPVHHTNLLNLKNSIGKFVLPFIAKSASIKNEICVSHFAIDKAQPRRPGYGYHFCIFLYPTFTTLNAISSLFFGKTRTALPPACFRKVFLSLFPVSGFIHSTS
jgi:hypothetical protein